MKVKVSASVLDCDFLHLEDELKAVVAGGIDALHLDIMDGHFVPNLSFGVPIARAVRRIITLPIYSHLMVIHPERIIDNFIPYSDFIVFHIEASEDPDRCIKKIIAANRKPGISLNPDTAIENLTPYLNLVDDVLIMSVYPGFGGQQFIPTTLDRIRRLRELRNKLGLQFAISVDGGINTENCRTIVESGADMLIAGSAIFRSSNYAAAIQKLKCSTS